MDRLAAIRVFVAVADAGSLSAAGQRLGMPLTTVSRHLKALEEAVSVRLLTRTTRRLALTEPGRAYLDTCRRVLDELGTAERHLAGEKAEPHGQLALTAPILFGRLHVRPVVSAYLEAHPQMSVRMVLVNRVVNLVEEGLDLSIRIGRLPDSSMRATTLGSVRQICCASPRYLKGAGVPQEPKDHPEFWKIWRETIKRIEPRDIDYVFASEPYGERLAKELDARFIPFDLGREMMPISGTEIREHPMKHWEMLPECTHGYFAKRVCVFGPESTGKSTLTRAILGLEPLQSGQIRLFGEPVAPGMANALRYTPTNAKAELSDEVAADVAYGEEGVKGLLRFEPAKIEANRAAWVDAWNKTIAR